MASRLVSGTLQHGGDLNLKTRAACGLHYAILLIPVMLYTFPHNNARKDTYITLR